MTKKGIPSQEEHDPNDPEEHFLWALRNMPVLSGVGAVTHPGILRQWSKHLWEAGFRHRDHLAKLADADGVIPVSRLPKQQIRFQKAFRGPSHSWNNAARWVPVDDTSDPEPVVVPDIREMTVQEQHALLYQFYESGLIPAPPPGPAQAAVHNE